MSNLKIFIDERNLYVKSRFVIDSRFIISVKTNNTGTSQTNQFTIPTLGTGYNYNIVTSDGQNITGLTGSTTITFSSVGTYDIFISGIFPQLYFNNTGDRLKLLNLKNFGIYGSGSTSQLSAFFGCNNMVISATDIGNFNNVTNFSQAWWNCSSLTSFPLINTSNGTIFSLTWLGCSGLTSFPLIDTVKGTNFSQAWQFCSSLTSFPLLNLNKVTSFFQAWRSCTNLTSYPQNAFNLNIASNYSNSFISTNLSTQSINNILISLDTSGVSNGTFNQSGGTNTPSSTGLTAKSNLVSKGWTITTN